ncbi:MAG: hypothetical protein JO182_14410, partial [Acidobacteriaceae bacterium]|nr:hypothetical protein [Acidobacteriaceae bacterium]
FNIIRSNPKFCGFNLTGMLDHGMTGEGVWRFWRDWKPGAFDAMQDGWAPLRWCLFVEPTHTYAGRPLTLEAVLANEDVLRPGSYPVEFSVLGPKGVAWQRKATIQIPTPTEGQDGPLAVPVLKEEAVLSGPAGAYQFLPYSERNFAPPEASWEFHLTDPSSLPHANASVVTWGVPDVALSWMKTHGVTALPLTATVPQHRELILVGDVSANSQIGDWKRVAEGMARGSTVVFLSPKAFRQGKDASARLPLARKGHVYEFNDWLYHKECVAKPHPIFEGLQGQGVLDWYYYGPVLPHYLFDGQDTPTEVIAAAFATGYSIKGGYASGVLMGIYQFNAGQFIVNSFPILENIDNHPVADRMLLNLIRYSADLVGGPAAELPTDFETQLTRLGYQ